MTHARELENFRECKVLNVYQVNIWKNLVFMYQVNSNAVSTIFLNKFKNPTRNYPTNFARTNYSIPLFKLNRSKYRIAIRGPTLWKNIPTDTEKKPTKDQYLNPLMHNVPKCSDTLLNLAAFAARLLKCVGPFWNIMH